MNSKTDKFVTLYKPTISLVLNSEIISISVSDIVSITFIHNYDTMTYPIIRLRLYSDISVIQKVCDYPDDIQVRGCLDAGIYKMNDENKSPTIVSYANTIQFQMKGYIENKNIPSSSFDQYQFGIKKTDDMNNNMKVPIEIFCYNETLVHFMKQKAPSIYKNMSITSIIEDIFTRNSIFNYKIDPLHNQTKYDQILIPNLDIAQTIAFFDDRYGLYRKGGQLYGDVDALYLCDTNASNNTKPLPIYVESSKNNSDMSGMKKINNQYQMTTMAGNVSVKTETDIERVLNAPKIADINLTTMTANTEELQNLYATTKDFAYSKNISTPNILHKTVSEYVASADIARLDENITEIDISGTGFDVSKIKVNSRYNMVFSSPIRGMDMNKHYRAAYACHVISNLDSNLFIAQTTMNLRTN